MEKVLQSFWPPCISKLDYFTEFLWKINDKWPRDFDQDLIRKWDRKVWHKAGVEASATIRTGWCPPGFVTHLFVLTSACGTEGSKAEGKRGKKRFKNGKAEVVSPGGPSNESTQLPPERLNPFLLGTRSWGRCSGSGRRLPRLASNNINSKAPPTSKGTELGQCQELPKDSSLNPSCS